MRRGCRFRGLERDTTELRRVLECNGVLARLLGYMSMVNDVG